MSSEPGKRSDAPQGDAAISNGAGREERISDFSPEWCRRLLDNPLYQQSDVFSRRPAPSGKASYNTLMRKTLFTNQTIRAIIYLYKPRESFEQERTDTTSDGTDLRLSGELLALVSVGDEMCSHTDVLHGGINTVLVDEIGGSLAFKEVPESDTLMAVNFNVNLRKSVMTPGLILGRAWVERPPEGRKVWIEVRLEQDGQICIESEIMYLKVKPKSNL